MERFSGSIWPTWLNEYFDMPTVDFRNEPLSLPTVHDLDKVFQALCMGCRIGDYEVVDMLLSTTIVNVNQVDDWNNSPLMLASLCGHFEIVRLLLSRGAICDRDTHEGARCVYGALNDSIRKLLISYDISKAVDQSQPFASHIASFLNSNDPVILKDIIFKFPQNVSIDDLSNFPSNRFVMTARSKYFDQKLKQSWNSNVDIIMPSTLDPKVFKVIIDYLYLKQGLALEDEEIQEPLMKYAQMLGLDDLVECVARIKETTSNKQVYKLKTDFAVRFVETARNDFHNYLDENIVNYRVQSKLHLQDDIDLEDIEIENFITANQRQSLFDSPAYPDIILASIDIETESIYYYPANKLILARSEYFATMFKSEIFLSSHDSMPLYTNIDNKNSGKVLDITRLDPNSLPLVHLSSVSTNSKVTDLILSYLYFDDIPNLTLDLAIELLFAADELLLERLKTLCAVKITSHFQSFDYAEFKSLKAGLGYNAYELRRIAWGVTCDKVGQHITKMIAHNLPCIYEDKAEKVELLDLIKESASMIDQRQETDTIELIDEIRFYLSEKYYRKLNFHKSSLKKIRKEITETILTNEVMKEHQRDFDIVDSLLLELNLHA